MPYQEMKTLTIDGTTYEIVDNAARSNITTLQALAGAPLVANTVSAMVDTTKVYVYTGSESGYTSGNWYYYSGSAWTSGGVYNSQGIGDGTITNEKLADSTVKLEKLHSEVIAAIGSGGSGSGLTDDIKQALLTCFGYVAWINDQGQTYYEALQAALYPPANLSSISCVYTQSGTVYTTASLDDLKSDLVVTALWSDNTTSTITNYVLSGTLTEGTSIITVTYGGKTTTFTVTVSVFTTAPSIAEYDKLMYSDGVPQTKVGCCYTNPYTFDIDIEELKASAHYDSTNDYMNYAGDIFKIKYVIPNSQSISTGGKTKWVVKSSTDTVVANGSISTASLSTLTDPRYTTALLNSGSTLKLVMTLFTADLADSYAYWDTTTSGVMPIGVSAGDIIFAGANTAYYGLSNISEASS